MRLSTRRPLKKRANPLKAKGVEDVDRKALLPYPHAGRG
jgi:hypothetical protein